MKKINYYYKYKDVKGSIALYKIKREIKRVFKQMGGIFKWKN